MSRWRTVWITASNFMRQFPWDLATVIGLTIIAILVVLLSGIQNTSFRTFLGLPFILFLPGYAFIAALFPEASVSLRKRYDHYSSRESDREIEGIDTSPNHHKIDTVERVALSFGLSIAIVPLIGLLLTFTPWGIRLLPTLLAIGSFTVIWAIIAAIRRQKLPKEDRFTVSFGKWVVLLQGELFDPDDRIDVVLNIILITVLIITVSSVGYTVMTPADGDQFSEFYLLTEDRNGELIADDYPTEFTQNEGQSLVIGISNHEYETSDYTVIVQLQHIETENGETTVVERQELDRFQTRLSHNETWHHDHEVTVSTSGENLRLTYLLYKGKPPAEPTLENSYRNLHLWIDVDNDSEVDIREPIAVNETDGTDETDSMETVNENDEAEERDDGNDSGIDIHEPIEN